MEIKETTYIEDSKLFDYAKKISLQRHAGAPISVSLQKDVLAKNLRDIKRVYAAISGGMERPGRPPEEFYWLYDNGYVIESEGRELLSAFLCPGKLPSTEGGKEPLVLYYAKKLVKAGSCELTEQRIRLFLEGLQADSPLCEAELSFFTAALKFSVIGELAAAALLIEEISAGYCGRKKNIFAKEHAIRTEPRKRLTGEENAVLDKAAAVHRHLSSLFSKGIPALRYLAAASLFEVYESVSKVEQILKKDPAGVYEKMDRRSKAFYRHRIGTMAKKAHVSEFAVAERLLSRAEKSGKHIGAYMLKQRGDSLRRRIYLYCLYVITLLFTTAFSLYYRSFLFGLLLFFPVYEIVKNLVEYFILHTVEPSRIVRYDFEKGVPDDAKTLCVIATLLTSEQSAAEVASKLEEYYLLNRNAGDNLSFGILADLKDSKRKHQEGEDAILKKAADEIDKLNKTYGTRFYFLFRERSFKGGENIYMGYERKRGALLELMRLLKGKQSGLQVRSKGSLPKGIRYVITLDNDTRLTLGSAAELIGAMHHPLNRPVIDRKRKAVVKGFGILQPRISVDLMSGNQTAFSKISAGQGGIDPYGSEMSDIYQDLFGRAIFTGKGILHVDAFYTCLDDAIPDNTVLSHDLLESGYLRAGLIADVELTDGFPAAALSYFDRSERWIRGDIQILGWLKKHLCNNKGKRVQNPVSPVTKYHMLDNIRRIFTPVFMLVLIFFGILSTLPIFTCATLLTLLAIGSSVLLTGAELALKSGSGYRARFSSPVICGCKGAFLQSVTFLILLPYNTWVSLSAVLRAAYRMLISKKHRLQWVTAAEGEVRNKTSLFYYLRRMLPALIIGLAAILIGRSPALSLLLGILWTLSPVYAWLISRKPKKKESLSADDRTFLLDEARKIFAYYECYQNEENHFLPPDNVQIEPIAGVAHRTSPTNIGLSLLCITSAKELGFIDEQTMLEQVERTLKTVEKMDKYQGHLYNWYDTKTLKPLSPRVVSTVDSGNLAACLITLTEQLKKADSKKAAELAARTAALAAAMRFDWLYDKKRKNLHIGYEVERNALTNSWYDMLASEARTTNYIAVARGEIEPKSWSRLGRLLVTDGTYFGLISWTGTMFEYLMPNLLLPVYENSLIAESLRFAVYAQEKRAQQKGVPFGISESSFYAFDTGLNYQYKAHGVQTLGLKKGLNKDLVIAPYASFLALITAPKKAMQNLRRLKLLEADGTHGLYEAIDYTKSRCEEGEYRTVASYMAHHMAMSLLAITNVLKDNLLQKDFLSNKEMNAYQDLLQEKLPIGAALIRSRNRQVPDKPGRSLQSTAYFEAKEGFDPAVPTLHILSNGTYTVTATDTGCVQSCCQGTVLTAADADIEGGKGFYCYLKIGGSYHSLMPSDTQNEGKYRNEFTGEYIRYFYKTPQFESCIELLVARRERAELRKVTIKNLSTVPIEGSLFVYFEPQLQRDASYQAHKTFSKLFIETERTGDTLIIKRRPRTPGEQLHLAFASSSPMTFNSSREEALGRVSIEHPELALNRDVNAVAGAVLDPCVLGQSAVSIQGGQSHEQTFAISFGTGRESVLALCSKALKGDLSMKGSLESLAKEVQLQAGRIEEVFEIAGALLFAGKGKKHLLPMDGELQMDKPALWKYGISLDNPILAVEIESEDDLHAALVYVQEYLFLRVVGIAFDLVFFVSEHGEYRRRQYREIVDFIKDCGIEFVLGQKEGIYILDNSAISPEDKAFLLSAASLYLLPKKDEIYKPVRNLKSTCKEVKCMQPAAPRPYEKSPHEELVSEGTTLPPLARSLPLCNKTFGTTLTECNTGHIWYKNARLNRVTLYTNDPLATVGSEQLHITAEGQRMSLFKAQDGIPCTVLYGRGYGKFIKQAENLSLTTTVFVPPDAPVKFTVIDIETTLKQVEVDAFYALQLSEQESDKRYVRFIETDTLPLAYSMTNRDFAPQYFGLCATNRLCGFTTSAAKWREGTLDSKLCINEAPILGAKFNVPVENGKARCVLAAFSIDNKEEAEGIKALLSNEALEAAFEKTVAHTNNVLQGMQLHTAFPVLDEYINNFALYQVYFCRLLAKTGIYQNGGAYGFRDQLQDVSALLHTLPEEARAHLLRAAAHQYKEGDVTHWWHETAQPERQKGVRTLCSDDLLWLPYTLALYCKKTGDESILSEQAPYLESLPLSGSEHERYEELHIVGDKDDLYTHAKKAIALSLQRGTGARGLPLMLGGDWNDGMNEVGAEGKGESSWLGFFTLLVLRDFIPLCEKRGDTASKKQYEAAINSLEAALAKSFEGDRYLRGYYDSGAKLGSAESEECRIDAIAQGFAALAGMDDGQVKTALKTANEALYDKEHKLIRLFTPPFEKSKEKAGYIQGYLKGVRENGGQYTHGVLWLILANLRKGNENIAFSQLLDLLPKTHEEAVYKAEPYVLAADVYTAPGHVGRGGWSWYTGAAAWYYRIVIEELLGLQKEGGTLRLEPRLPDTMDGYTLDWRCQGKNLHIEVIRAADKGLTVNGQCVPDGKISLQNCTDNTDIVLKI